MSSRIRQLSVLASLAALTIGGSAAAALPSPPAPASAASQPSGSEGWLPGLGYLRGLVPGPSPAAAPADAPKRIRPTAAGLPAGAFAGYATATVFHTDPELARDNDGDNFNAEYDLGLSDAAHTSVPLPSVTDELGRQVIPALDAGHSFGQGRGVKLPAFLEEVDLGADLEPALAQAPPSTTPVRKSARADLEFVRADTFEAEALARAIPTGCVLGDDLARGLGAANQTGVDLDGDFDDERKPLLSVSVEEPPPPRAVSQSLSRVALSPKPVAPGRFGGIAESRLTVAPITFGIPGATRKDDILFTLELAGEFVLRGAADGQNGNYFFGPEGADDARPIARLFQNGKEVGGAGFGDIVPIKVGDETIGEIRIGDDPHAIGGDSAAPPIVTGTRVAAVADVAVVRFFAIGAQQRIGHIEVDLTVPAGGVPCPGIAMEKRSEPASVTPGSPFTYTIDVSNPNDCVLSSVKVRDTVTAEPGVNWKVLTTLPRSTIGREGTLIFDLDSLRPAEHKTIRINAEAGADSKPGALSNEATATGECSAVPLAGAATAVTTIRAGLTPAGPSVGPVNPPPSFPVARSGAATPPAPAAPSRAVHQSADLPRAGGNGVATAGSQARSGGLARTGATLPLALAFPLLALGRMLRRAKRQ